MDERFNKVEERFDRIDERLDKQDPEISLIKENTARRVDYEVDERIELERRVEALEDRLGMKQEKITHI